MSPARCPSPSATGSRCAPSRQRKLLLVSPFAMDQAGGVTQTIANLFDALSCQNRYTPFILENCSQARPDCERIFSYPFRSFLWQRTIHLRALAGFIMTFRRERARIHRLLAEQHINLIHLHYFADYYGHFATARCPLLITLHGSDIRLDLQHSVLLRRSARRLFARAHVIVLPSASLADDFLALFPQCYNRVRVILNGAYQQSPQPLELTLPDHFILCTANLQPVKGHDLLIRAFARIHDRAPQYHLCLAGEGTERAALTSLAAALGVQDHVLFLGKRSAGQVSSLLQKCEFYVQPSRNEGGHPLAVMEAMLAGKAVAATAAGGLREMVRHGETGLVSPPEDIDGLADAILQLINSPSLRQQLAAAAQQQARSEYTRAAMSERYCTLYDEVLHAAEKRTLAHPASAQQ